MFVNDEKTAIFHWLKVGLKDLLYHPDIPFHYPTYLRNFPVGQAVEFQDRRKKGRYKDWSKGNKGKWTNLLAYNRLDVEGSMGVRNVEQGLNIGGTVNHEQGK